MTIGTEAAKPADHHHSHASYQGPERRHQERRQSGSAAKEVRIPDSRGSGQDRRRG